MRLSRMYNSSELGIRHQNLKQNKTFTRKMNIAISTGKAILLWRTLSNSSRSFLIVLLTYMFYDRKTLRFFTG